MGGCNSRPNRIVAADNSMATSAASDASAAQSEDWLEAAATKMAG